MSDKMSKSDAQNSLRIYVEKRIILKKWADKITSDPQKEHLGALLSAAMVEVDKCTDGINEMLKQETVSAKDLFLLLDYSSVK